MKLRRSRNTETPLQKVTKPTKSGTAKPDRQINMRTLREAETEKHFTGRNRDRRGSVLWSLRALLFTMVFACSAAQAQEAIEAWVQRYDGHGDRIDSYVKDMAVDASGNVYVTGESGCTDPPLPSEWATIKYSSVGVPLWTNYCGDPVGGGDARAIAVDAQGNVAVTGIEDWDIATILYSSAGIPLWTNRYRPPISPSEPAAMAVDANGNVFVVGYTGNSSGGNDYLILKYSSTGARLWTRTYSGPGDSYDFAQAVAVDVDGNVVVTGSSDDDYVTLKYSSTGALIWNRRYNGPGGWYGPGKGQDLPWAVAVDSEGDVIVTGRSDGGTNITSYATIKYRAPVSRYGRIGTMGPKTRM